MLKVLGAALAAALFVTPAMADTITLYTLDVAFDTGESVTGGFYYDWDTNQVAFGRQAPVISGGSGFYDWNFRTLAPGYVRFANVLLAADEVGFVFGHADGVVGEYDAYGPLPSRSLDLRVSQFSQDSVEAVIGGGAVRVHAGSPFEYDQIDDEHGTITPTTFEGTFAAVSAPEPSTWAMLLLGAAALALFSRRRIDRQQPDPVP